MVKNVELKVGCCGFPGGMESYFNEFKLVEVQTTFYNLPKVETAKVWRRRAPKDFEFTVKAWQGITHPPTMPTWRRTRLRVSRESIEKYGLLRNTTEVFESWSRTREICKTLEAKICLIQCPSCFEATKTNIENMKQFFSTIDRGGLTIAWEPRGDTWTEKLIESLCRELELVYCIDLFAKPIPHFGETVYLRLHGKPPGSNLYNYKYSDGDLKKLSTIINRLDREVYCLFNNKWMREDAKRLLDIIK
jgi:uncharacterized protein YecE (DUF72 family)